MLLCTALAAALLLAPGCGRPADRTPDGRVIVTYWEKWPGFEAEAMQAVVDDFNASQDRIFVTMTNISQIEQKLLLATAGGNPPDVSGLWSHLVNVYAEKGALIPLDRWVEEAGITREDYIPVIWDLCRHRGFIWALPTTPATLALHWNKDMFREAGLDPDKPPRSLAEFEAMNERLTKVRLRRGGETVVVRYDELTDEEKQAKQFEILQLGHSPNEPGWYREMWGYWFGGELWDGESVITTACEENIDAYTWYESYPKRFGVRNLLNFGDSFGNFASPQNAFLAGKVAMVLQGVWMYNFIDKFAPHMDWGAAPFPSADPARLKDVTIIECDLLVIPYGAKHPEEAWEFIRFVNTQAALEKLNHGQRKFTPLRKVSEGFLENHPNPYIRTFMDLAYSENALYVPRCTVWNEYKDEMIAAGDKIFTLAATPTQALEHVETRMQWKLDRVLRRWELVKDERLSEWAER